MARVIVFLLLLLCFKKSTTKENKKMYNKDGNKTLQKKAKKEIKRKKCELHYDQYLCSKQVAANSVHATADWLAGWHEPQTNSILLAVT